jgi:hypothetical protein
MLVALAGVIAAGGLAAFRLEGSTPQAIEPPYCWHDRFVVSSEWHCGGGDSSLATGIAASFTLASRHFEDRDTIVIRKNGGRGANASTRIALQEGADAVFMSRFAVDYMLIPYFLDEHKSAVAAQVKEHADKAWPSAAPNNMLLICQHLRTEPEWFCSDSTNTVRIPPGTVAGVELIRHDGSAWYRSRYGRGADAIFWSRESATKILLAYYARKATRLSTAIAKKWPGPR